MTPLCPRCNAPMVMRTAYKGTARQRDFWGCSNFPSCRGTRDLESQENAAPTSPAKAAGTSNQNVAPAQNIVDITIPVKFEAEPFEGFELMDSFETIACDSSVLESILNENIDATVVQSCSKFRVDFTEALCASLSDEQRQIAALALRMLCRGSITKNTRAVERAISDLFSGEVKYTDRPLNGNELKY